MPINVLQLENDGLIVGNNQLTTTGGGVYVGRNLVVNGNTVLTGGLQANGSIGANTNILYSNGTNAYWAPPASVANPTFSVFTNTQRNISFATATKVLFDQKEFDTDNAFDSVFLNRFNPKIPGIYEINANVGVIGTSSLTNGQIILFKNGVLFKYGSVIQTTLGTNSVHMFPIAALVQMNGTTDFLEIYAFIGGTGTATVDRGADRTYFQGTLVRSYP
jgi:hypothetical protein